MTQALRALLESDAAVDEPASCLQCTSSPVTSERAPGANCSADEAHPGTHAPGRGDREIRS